MYSAIDQVMDKIEKQLKRHRSKIRNRRTEGIKGENTLEMEETEEGKSPSLEGPSIEIEKMLAKKFDGGEIPFTT